MQLTGHLFLTWLALKYIYSDTSKIKFQINVSMKIHIILPI